MTKTMSEPIKYGYVCQLADRKKVRLSSIPTIEASRVKRPASTRRPIVISVAMVTAPASVACSAACIRMGRIGEPRPYEMIWAPM